MSRQVKARTFKSVRQSVNRRTDGQTDIGFLRLGRARCGYKEKSHLGLFQTKELKKKMIEGMMANLSCEFTYI